MRGRKRRDSRVESDYVRRRFEVREKEELEVLWVRIDMLRRTVVVLEALRVETIDYWQDPV
jgi:hypothetical protein